jgi:predicted PurR-regulated permease PerM
MDNAIHPSKIYQSILIGIILILAFVLWKELGFLFPSFLGAVALYILLRDPMHWLVKEKRMKDWLAASILMTATIVIIMVPLFFLVRMLIIRISPLVSSPDFFSETFREINDYVNGLVGTTLLTQDTIMKMSGKLTIFAQQLLSGTFRQLMILLFMYVFLYFMMVNSRRMEVSLRRNLPFRSENRDKIQNEITRMVRSNAITIPTVALLQGAVALAGYLIFKVSDPVLLGVLTAISSMIPVVGAMLVYLPVVINTLAIGELGNGIGLALWCFILVGGVDNVARFLLQKRLANVHPLITILGVIVGTKLFGLIGLIFGPLTITLFVVLVKVYFNEFGNFRSTNIVKASGKPKG